MYPRPILAGIKYKSRIDKPLDGKSLKPLLVENDKQWPSRLIFSHWDQNTSVRSQKYRLNGNGKLYNMAQDPGQRDNIAAEQPQIAQSLMDSLNRWKSMSIGTIKMEKGEVS